MAAESNKEHAANRKVIAKLLIAVVAMFGFGFALVPLYDVFCSVTGINGKTPDQVSSFSSVEADASREIKVEFLTSLNEYMPWEFKALQDSVIVIPGQPTKVEFWVRNMTNKDMVGQAIPSVSPGFAAKYFQKTECFCFTEQVLKAGEEKVMPVVFTVDPSISEDVHEITLSYTFFIKPGTEGADRRLKISSVSKALANHTNQGIQNVYHKSR
ncbi:MAG: cytochrome c oxidase assembly protein [Gammaproteobacteria bacterium]|nr:MAG: cytochrome c oxidase assembly protein [Gammaproteobacteria bacterium]